MQTLQTLLAAGAVVLITVTGDYFALQKGQDANREKMLAHAVQAMQHLPEQIGPWTMEGEEPFSARTLQMLQVEGYCNRIYVHSQTGDQVSMTVLAGEAGPLVAHSPEVCMQSRDFEMISTSRDERLELSKENTADLGKATFKSRALRGDMLDVYYAWSRNGRQWEAPESPRITLGGSPMLYKVQVAARAPLATEDAQSSVGMRFLRDLLPVLQRELSTPTK